MHFVYDNEQSIINYQMLNVIDDNTILALRWPFASENASDALVKFNFIQRKDVVILEFPEAACPELNFPITQMGYFFSPDYKGLDYRNIPTNTNRVLAQTGEVRALSADGNYVVTFEAYTDTAGYGSGRLVLWDTVQHRSRVIYDQKFGSGNSGPVNADPNPPLQVGDSIYGFVGMDMNGIPVFMPAY